MVARSSSQPPICASAPVCLSSSAERSICASVALRRVRSMCVPRHAHGDAELVALDHLAAAQQPDPVAVLVPHPELALVGARSRRESAPRPRGEHPRPVDRMDDAVPLRRRSCRSRPARSRAAGACHLVVLEAVAAQVPVPQAQVRALQRQLELLGALPALARGARLEAGEGLAPQLAAVQAERRRGGEDDTKKSVYSTACWRQARKTSASARLTATISGLSMCSSGGERLRSARQPRLVRAADGAADHDRARARDAARSAPSTRAAASRIRAGVCCAAW